MHMRPLILIRYITLQESQTVHELPIYLLSAVITIIKRRWLTSSMLGIYRVARIANSDPRQHDVVALSGTYTKIYSDTHQRKSRR